jgi:hypothetical protein
MTPGLAPHTYGQLVEPPQTLFDDGIAGTEVS